jgi:hypothetical protein
MNDRPRFPAPVYFGPGAGRRYWDAAALDDYDRRVAGQEALSHAPAERRYLSAAEVRRRYGNISDMTLWRWTRPARDEQAA